jgi:hypothetical protein
MTDDDSIHDRPTGTLATVRAFFGSLDLVIGILLAAMLLPLVLGPIVMAYQFVQAGQYLEAGAIVLLAAGCYAVGCPSGHARGVWTRHRFSVLAFGGIILFIAIRFRR